MHDLLTSISLVVLTVISLAACAVAFARLMRPPEHAQRLLRIQGSLLGLCIVGSAALFLYRWLLINQKWQPLEAHVDGLLLIAALFGAMVMFLQKRAKLLGLSAFALPVLTLLLAWAICASAWTFHPFQIGSVWTGTHLGSVYLGTLSFALSAIAGGMYLYVERRLRHKSMPGGGAPLASLEALERLIIRGSAIGFALLTLGLVTGLIIATSQAHNLRPGWWHAPKITLGLVAWIIAALVMNVRHATFFRGSRAAWLTIAVLLLILGTLGAANKMPPISLDAVPSEPTQEAP